MSNQKEKNTEFLRLIRKRVKVEYLKVPDTTDPGFP